MLKLLQGINENKATGPDDIPGKLLKICAFELHEVFTILFQISLNLGAIPDDWKSAHIFPLLKRVTNLVLEIIVQFLLPPFPVNS